MYCLMFAFDVRPEQREAFRALGLAHMEECLRKEDGTLHFFSFQDEEDANRFYVFEAYSDREAQEKHLSGSIMARNWPVFEPMLAAPVIPLGRGLDFQSDPSGNPG